MFVAAIGHCCANKVNLAASTREYRERTLLNEQETYLLAHVPLVPACLSVIEQAKPAAREARRIYRYFRTHGAEFQRALRLVKMNSGRLTVSEQIEGEIAAFGPAGFRRPTTGSNVREVEFGTLRGMIALNTQYDPVDELDRIESRLRSHNHAQTEEAYIDYIAEMTPKIAEMQQYSCEKRQTTIPNFRHELPIFATYSRLRTSQEFTTRHRTRRTRSRFRFR
jgi:hypothetical protein